MDIFRTETPINSPKKTDEIEETPIKATYNVRLPQGKNCICLLCREEVTNHRHRNKLFQNILTKTDSCKRIETVLVSVPTQLAARVICKG